MTTRNTYSELPTDADVPTATIHDILRNDRRRGVIEALGRSRGPTDVRSLAERIAEGESEQIPPPASLRKSVYNSLNQTHLPKLAREGVIDYDADRKEVRACVQARSVGRYLDMATPYGGLWSTFYRTLATVSLTLVLLSLVNGPLIGQVDPLLWATLGLAAVALSTTYQLWRLRGLYLLTVLGRDAE